MERRNKARPASHKAEHEQRAVREETSVDRHHPFAALQRLRGQMREPVPRASAPSALSELVDAPHSAFTLDARGRIFAHGRQLGRIVRGAQLLAPNVQLAPLEDLGAGVQSRLQRRLLAFARDSVGRLLEALAPLRRSEHGSVRAIAYQLERGLGTASVRELAPSVAELDVNTRARLQEAGVTLGRVSLYLAASLRAPALELRATLLGAYHRDLQLPPLGRPHYEIRSVTPQVWLAAGYVTLGPRACRVDLVERAAAAIEAGAQALDSLRNLSLPRRDANAVARALERLVPPPASRALVNGEDLHAARE